MNSPGLQPPLLLSEHAKFSTSLRKNSKENLLICFSLVMENLLYLELKKESWFFWTHLGNLTYGDSISRTISWLIVVFRRPRKRIADIFQLWKRWFQRCYVGVHLQILQYQQKDHNFQQKDYTFQQKDYNFDAF